MFIFVILKFKIIRVEFREAVRVREKESERFKQRMFKFKREKLKRNVGSREEVVRGDEKF